MPRAKTGANKKQPEDLDILTKFHRWLQNAIDDTTWVSWRKNAIRCYEYRENKQWTSADSAELVKRKQPETINNQVSVTVARQVGQFVKLKARTAFRGRNDVDDDSADTLSDLFLYVRQNNGLEFEERDVFEDGTICGYGVFDVGITFDDLFQPEISINQENPFDIIPDPKSRRYDWNEDAQHIFRVKWVDLDDAQARFPNKAEVLHGLFDDATRGLLGNVDVFRNNNFLNQDRQQLRIAEVQYKVKEKQVLLLFPDGSTLLEKDSDPSKVAKARAKFQKEGKEVLKMERLEEVLWGATFTAGVLLEHKKLKRKFFRWVPYWVHRKQNGEPFSEIFISLPMQDAINKRESKALHLLTTNQAIYEEGAVADKSETASEIARPDGQIEVARGFFEKFKLEKNVELAAAQMQMHQASQSDFRSIVGISPESRGENTSVRSGLGIQKKLEQTELIMLPNFSNFTRTRSILAYNVLDLMKIYYTEPKIRFITDEVDQSRRPIALGQETIESIKQNQYDVVITVRPDIETADDEQLNKIKEQLPNLLPFGPFWVKMGIELSDIPRKKELLEKLSKVPPPPVIPKINITAQLDQMGPLERAWIYEKMGDKELAEQIREQAPPPTNIIKKQMQTEKTMGKLTEVGMKIEAAAGDGGREEANAEAQGERDFEKGQLDLIKQVLEIEKKEVEVDKAKASASAQEKKAREGNKNKAR